MHPLAVVWMTGLLAFQNPTCQLHFRHSTGATKSFLHISETNQVLVDEAGESWKAFSESAGFCNQIFTSTTGERKMRKVYSDLAQRRMRLSGNQNFDEIMGDLKIGPAVFESTEKFVIMEELAGRVLSNEDLLTSNNMSLKGVAETLAKLHCVQGFKRKDGKSDRNMLWDCCNVLLEELKEWDENLYLTYSSELKYQKFVLESLSLPLVLGHGDFKPSNVIVLNDSGEARLIDWETCGCHYRAYDLAKFFRAVEPKSKEEDELLSKKHLTFLRKYCEQVRRISGTNAKDPNVVFFESKLLLPMTWLEAALFFHCKSFDDESDSDAYTRNAEQRLQSFRKSLDQWKINLNEYQSLLK